MPSSSAGLPLQAGQGDALRSGCAAAAVAAPLLLLDNTPHCLAEACLPSPRPFLPQAAGQAVAAVEGGQHAQRGAAYRALVQQLLTLNVRDGAAVQQLMGAVLAAMGGGECEAAAAEVAAAAGVEAAGADSNPAEG